jgi:DNA polymerase elongation subunit (family B)
MRTPFGASSGGSSITFDTFIYSQLTEQNQFIRYGINNEGGKNIEPEDVNQYPMLKDKKGSIMKPAKIPARTFSNVVTRYPGAFVKIPQPKIVNDGSMVIDLDAASLYPSMILQANISFDSYHGRIIPVCTYKTIDLLSQCLGKQPIPQQLFTNLEKLVWNYVDKKVKNQKTQTANTMYYMLVRLFDLLSQSGLTLEQIFQPSNTHESIVLRTTFIPLMDLINMIHPLNPGYSQFTYDYLFVNPETFKSKYQGVYIIHNAGETDTNIVGYTIEQAVPVIQKYIITLAGTIFQKHEEHMGLFTNFLNRMGNLRKMYKGMRQESEGGSYEYTLNDNRQASVKVIMNTTYGLYGLSSFRYSNHWLAQSITNNGEMTIKMAQVIGDQHLIYKYGSLR